MDNVGHETNTTRLQNVTIDDDRLLKGTTNIGADDKCGVAIALYLWLKHPDKVNVLFTREEESGGIGVQQFIRKHSDLLNMCPYAVLADRKGSSDIISSYNDYCTKEFEDKIVEVSLGKFGYKPAHGVWSDADHLSELMNSINMSCGYYDQHTERESVKLDEFENCCDAIEDLVLNYRERLPKPDKSYARGSIFGREYDCYHNYGYSYSGGTTSMCNEYIEDHIMFDGNVAYTDCDIVFISADGIRVTLPCGDYRVELKGNNQYSQSPTEDYLPTWLNQSDRDEEYDSYAAFEDSVSIWETDSDFRVYADGIKMEFTDYCSDSNGYVWNCNTGKTVGQAQPIGWDEFLKRNDLM